MPSTIINIHSYGNYYHVDPTMPAVLRSSGGVNEVEWKSFCDQVNARLDTFNKARKLSVKITYALFGIAILACVGIVADIIVADMINGQKFFIIPVVLFFVGACCVICNTSNQLLDAYKDVHDICVETSKRNSNVSYHFRNTVQPTQTAEGTQYAVS
jgi:hypothetical protein